MKKKVAVLLACLLTVGAGSAFAAANSDSPTAQSSAVHAQAHIKKINVLKTFQAEIHQLDSLRTQRLDLKKQIVEKQDKLVDLTVAAKDKGDKDALKAAAEIRKQIHKVNTELKTLATRLKEHRKEFRQAVKAGNETKARTAINEEIAVFGKINAKLSEKAGLLDQMVAALS